MSEAIEAKLTMAPPRPSESIFFTPACRQWKTPLTLTWYSLPEAWRAVCVQRVSCAQCTGVSGGLPVHLGVGSLLHRAHRTDAGVVDEDVAPPPVGTDRIEARVDPVRDGHVARVASALIAFAPAPLDRGADRWRSQVEDVDVSTRGAEDLGDREPNPAGAACYDGSLAREREGHFRVRGADRAVVAVFVFPSEFFFSTAPVQKPDVCASRCSRTCIRAGGGVCDRQRALP